MFGKATGAAHNIERSTGMLRQLESVGIFDNAAVLPMVVREVTKASAKSF